MLRVLGLLPLPLLYAFFGCVAWVVRVSGWRRHLVIARLGRGAWRGDFFSGVLLAALCGFLLVGVTESLFDGPRVT